MSDNVLLDIADGIATITLNRPAQLNVLSVEMMHALHQTVRKLAADTSVQVVIVRGAGDHFMAGGDIREFHGHMHLSPEARLPAFRAMIEQHINPAVEGLRNLHQPVIAQVRGACAGFGLSLMLVCDFAIAAEDAMFTTAYAQIGLSPDGGASYFLPRIVGSRKAAELLLLAERFEARQALELGLVNRVVPVERLESETLALARRLQNGARHAYAEIKRLLNSSPGASLTMQLLSEAESFARCGTTQDFAEGVSAFIEKRKPVFKGK